MTSPSDGAPFSPGDTVCGRYSVLSVVGAGPLGWVFRVHDGAGGGELALKLLHPHLLRTESERRHCADTLRQGRRVDHPGLLPVLDVGEEQGRPFFTAPFLEGVSLRRILETRRARGQRFTLEDAEPLLAQLVSALDAAHGIAPHGDLKPDNIFVLPDALRVTDFALCASLPRGPFVEAQRQALVDRYLAPELKQGTTEPRADVFALAVIVEEMLAGGPPGEGGAAARTRGHAVLPREAEGFLKLARHPNAFVRPRSPSELLAELTAILRRPSASIRRAPPPPVPGDEEPTQSIPPPEGWGVAEERPPPPVPDEAPSGRSSSPEVPWEHVPDAPAVQAWPAERRGRTEVLELPVGHRGALLAVRLMTPVMAAGAIARGVPRPYVWMLLLALAGVAAGVIAGRVFVHRASPVPSLQPPPPDIRLGPT
ncbi:MAG: protein kinase [Myxococcaceae bacterium]|nr:protein kinase [Myxococcaceae bacterium]